MSIKRDVPIVLGDITYEDNYDGDFNTRRAVIYTMTFTAKTYLYGLSEAGGGVIRKVQSDVGGSTEQSLQEMKE